jgi:nicotinamide-nucleotide amidase
MIAELISVGTELLLGNILNSNARYLSEECANLGLSVFYQTVVGDNENRLKFLLNQALERSDIIILTGGLGPTQDDLTKEVVAKVLKKPLVKHAETEKRLIKMFQLRNIEMAQNNLKQALIPEGATVLTNNNGTAPGLIVTQDKKSFILLPGPPKEMIPLFETYVMPFIRELSPELIHSKVLKVVGVGESSLEEKLIDLIENQTNPTLAPYAKDGEVHLRLTAKTKSIEQALSIIEPMEQEIKRRIGKAVYTDDGAQSLEEVVAALLVEKGLTLSTAESCTGGLLSAAFVNYSGISAVFKEGVVTYSNEAKMKRIGVQKATLEQFGAVSAETAEEMVRGVAKLTNTDVALSVTGIAGPTGGTEEKPVGLVYISCYIKGKVHTKAHHFSGHRQKIRNNTVTAALNMLRLQLLES